MIFNIILTVLRCTVLILSDNSFSSICPKRNLGCVELMISAFKFKIPVLTALIVGVMMYFKKELLIISFNIKIKFNIKKSHQNISGGIFGGEPINFD